MRKGPLGAILVGFSLLLGGCSLPSFQRASSGVFVETSPTATVFIDEQQMGTTPYENKKLKPGEITLRLVPQAAAGTTLASWEGKVRLTPGVQTVIRRAFGETLAASSGSVLTLDKLGGKTVAMSVVSTPDAAAVKLDGQSQGFTPLALESVSEGEHQLLLSAPGYQDKLVSAKAVAGHRLIVSVQLAQLAQLAATASPTPEASGSPKASPTPSPKASVTPQASLPPKPYVLILDTPTGWLRVRTDSSITATEAAKVNPGQAFPYKDVSSDNNWYQIEFKTGSLGWISAQYAKKVE